MNTLLLQNNVQSLIEEGQGVLLTKFDSGTPGGRQWIVELQPFAKWQAGCLNLLRMLGDVGEQWRESFTNRKNTTVATKRMLGTLEAIAESLQNGLLVKVEDLIRAESFENLLDQADYLFSEGYFLPAGVLGRAVLEQYLNKWCELSGCFPQKPRPTISDFKDSLYKSKQINLTQMKHIESLASIGNDAAHNKPALTEPDVSRLLRDVRDLLVRHPLSTV